MIVSFPGSEIVGMAKSLFYAFRAWSDIQRFEPAALAVFYASAIVSLHLRPSELFARAWSDIQRFEPAALVLWASRRSKRVPLSVCIEGHRRM